jgi:hypothetical protein
MNELNGGEFLKSNASPLPNDILLASPENVTGSDALGMFGFGAAGVSILFQLFLSLLVVFVC